MEPILTSRVNSIIFILQAHSNYQKTQEPVANQVLAAFSTVTRLTFYRGRGCNLWTRRPTIRVNIKC